MQVSEAPSLLPLTTLDGLDAALAASSTHPVLFFKHSQTCGTSALAFEEIEAWLEAHRPAGADLYIVDVHGGRAVARALAERLGVRHESPQVLLVREGAVVWHGSHFQVTVQALERALAPLLARA